MTTNGAELIVVLLSLAAVSLKDWAIAMLAIQILAIDLLAEGFFGPNLVHFQSAVTGRALGGDDLRSGGFGCLQDVEFSVSMSLPFPENLFLVQARPESVWGKKKKESVLGKKTGLELLFEKATTPIKLKID